MPAPTQRLVDRHSLRLLKMDKNSSASSGLPPNNSNQKLVAEDYLENSTSNGNGIMHSASSGVLVDSSEIRINHGSARRKMSKQEILTVGVLCFVNLINYMDRFTIAGILEKIQAEFDIDNSKGGLLQTAFVVSYMVFAPLFGYLGDRYSRKYLMASGVGLWCLTTLLGSFMQSFEGFITFRALVGIGEASYSTIAPTIISDMFVDDRRSRMLAFFYFAIPVGSGMGYIVGSETEKIAKDWRWGLRVTPIMGLIAVLLILFLMTDPLRGESENSHLKPTSYKEDVIYLCKNPSFMLSTLGFTCVAFVTGALAWWGPKFIASGLKLQDGGSGTSEDDVSFKFGLITMISGIIGVPLGSIVAQKLRERNSRADPLVCAFGLLMSTPLLFAAAIMARYNDIVCFTLIFFGELFLNLNCCSDSCSDTDSSVAFIFGAITVASGILGVIAGPLLSQKLKSRFPRIDAIICGVGLLTSMPFIGLALYFARTNITIAYVLMFFGTVFLNMNWALVADILLYVVIPTRRSTAEAFQILLSHALGDAGSPYLIGLVSDGLSKSMSKDDGTADFNVTTMSPNNSTSDLVKFESLQYSLFITSFVEVFGGLFFLICAWYIIEDKLKTDRAIAGDELMNEGSEPTHYDADEPSSLN
ncbi:unnamed protein product [Allacma fusca]|uniref:Major facilitator superfamily (MFS) profile domain-containing protein n=1 Tax=Allacma fusca TaxID=39272 RepID=A0A8J2KRR5_9HEXA|nr:unnamed protein product [Allacma fusca]